MINIFTKLKVMIECDSPCLEYYKNHQIKSIQILNDFKIRGINPTMVNKTGLIINILNLSYVISI